MSDKIFRFQCWWLDACCVNADWQVAKAASMSLNNAVNCLPGLREVDEIVKHVSTVSVKLSTTAQVCLVYLSLIVQYMFQCMCFMFFYAISFSYKMLMFIIMYLICVVFWICEIYTVKAFIGQFQQHPVKWLNRVSQKQTTVFDCSRLHNAWTSL